MTLGKFLVVLYSNHCGERKNGSKGGKAMRAMSKNYMLQNREGVHSDDAVKKRV